jgi:hypothetical protein
MIHPAPIVVAMSAGPRAGPRAAVQTPAPTSAGISHAAM